MAREQSREVIVWSKADLQRWAPHPISVAMSLEQPEDLGGVPVVPQVKGAVDALRDSAIVLGIYVVICVVASAFFLVSLYDRHDSGDRAAVAESAEAGRWGGGVGG